MHSHPSAFAPIILSMVSCKWGQILHEYPAVFGGGFVLFFLTKLMIVSTHSYVSGLKCTYILHVDIQLQYQEYQRRVHEKRGGKNRTRTWQHINPLLSIQVFNFPFSYINMSCSLLQRKVSSIGKQRISNILT